MIAVIGALFMVGTALSFFISSMRCNRVDLFSSPRYGALWAIPVALTQIFTQNAYATAVASWIPTMLMVYTAEYTSCKEKTIG